MRKWYSPRGFRHGMWLAGSTALLWLFCAALYGYLGSEAGQSLSQKTGYFISSKSVCECINTIE
jgi:hypothetical protein